jgi:ribose 5-phosphate isomerase B
MKIYLATDHAGYELKEKIKQWLKEWSYDHEDMGAFEYNEQDDYTDFVHPLAKEVALRQTQGDYNTRGIVVGGTGQGEAMVSNKYDGIRAAVYYAHNLDMIKLSREHNNANVLSIAARFVSEEDAKEAIKLWLEMPFPGDERHVRRISKIDRESAS